MRFALSWMLYLSGDLFCRAFVSRTLGYYFEWPYHVYSWLMATSEKIQGPDKGPWGDYFTDET